MFWCFTIYRLTPQFWSLLTVDSAEQLQQLRATLAACQAPSPRDKSQREESQEGNIKKIFHIPPTFPIGREGF